MGKYKKNWANYDEGLITTNHRISNELAEANRLKRLEILHKHKHIDPQEGVYYSINESELEDKA